MAFENSVLGDVVEWFLGRIADRRQYKRRTGAFHVWWHPDPSDPKKREPGVGVDISPNGLVYIIPQTVTAREHTIEIRLRDRTIPLHVKIVRSDVVDHQGAHWNRYMVEYQGIAADDWDLIVRHVNDSPEPRHRRKMQNQEMIKQVDDAYRLLPLAVQRKIVAVLVEQKKLAPPKPGQTPLLKLFYGGLRKMPGKPPAHRFNVHSRIRVNDDTMAYDTRFLVDDAGDVSLA
jgi:hypothetical protein